MESRLKRVRSLVSSNLQIRSSPRAQSLLPSTTPQPIRSPAPSLTYPMTQPSSSATTATKSIIRVAMGMISRLSSCRSHHEYALLSMAAIGTIGAMKAVILSRAIVLTLALGALRAVYADSATWNVNPISNDWNTAVNWMPNTVPNGPNDTATFDDSNITQLSLSDGIEVDSIVFNPGAAAFPISNKRGVTLTISGAGITNNSGVLQNFVNHSKINFRDQASAGEAVFTNELSAEGSIIFYDSSTADRATVTNEAHAFNEVLFHNNSTAGNATIINEGGDYYLAYGITYLYDTASAGTGLFIANGSLTTYYGYATVDFFDNSKAGNGTFIANGGQVPGASGGNIFMLGYSTAENGTFYANGGMVTGAFGGRVYFLAYEPTAASATLIANGGVGTGEGEGGGIVFASGSVGAEARIKLFGNGFLDVRYHDTPELTIGSLEGDGLVFLGGVNLSVGSNNLSTIFSGLIEENSEGMTGALTKIGTGTLMLTNANTYTDGTTISGGRLQVNNMDGSATGTGAVQVNAGILAGRGTIAGMVIVGTG